VAKSKKKPNYLEIFQVPGEILPELLLTTIDIGTTIRWALTVTYFQASQLLANPYINMNEKGSAFNLMMMMLRAMVQPIQDGEFEERMSKLYEKYRNDYEEKYWTIPSYGITILEEVIQLLNRKDILVERRGTDTLKVHLEKLFEMPLEVEADEESNGEEPR